MKQTPSQFINPQSLWPSFKERVIPYITDKEYKGKVSTFTLPKSMSDSALQKENNSTPISVEYFASAIKDFLETADKSKYYIGHIKTEKKAVAFGVYWDDVEWDFYAHDFDRGIDWREGYLFLSFATADSQTLSTDTSDSLTLDSAIKICKDAGLTVTKTY